MTNDEFMEAGSHFCNLDEEQLQDVFVWEEIEKLPNDEFTIGSLLRYSQYVSGNIEETLKELEDMPKFVRIKNLQIWAEITKDADLLRDLLHKVVHNLMK
jgi:hypothetical protein